MNLPLYPCHEIPAHDGRMPKGTIRGTRPPQSSLEAAHPGVRPRQLAAHRGVRRRRGGGRGRGQPACPAARGARPRDRHHSPPRAPQVAPRLAGGPSGRGRGEEATRSVNTMDTMERYKIQASIKEVIATLDSAPFRRDLIPEANVVQLTNRMADAHLAIEKGLKALIRDVGGTPECIHDLNILYRDLRDCDASSADYFATAFKDAVTFFGYNTEVGEFGHFSSLGDYLSKAGTESAFQELRYWAIEGTRKRQSAIPYISPPIHRELLRALWCLFLPGVRETVSQRVEREVTEAMFSRRHLSYGSDDEDKEHSVRQYKNWLFEEHSTCRSALKEAVRLNFSIDNQDEFASRTQREAFNDLRQSKDPAVQDFLRRLTYLPKESQWPSPGAKPRMKWSNKAKTAGLVETPAGTCLGFIEKYADGGVCRRCQTLPCQSPDKAGHRQRRGRAETAAHRQRARFLPSTRPWMDPRHRRFRRPESLYNDIRAGILGCQARLTCRRGNLGRAHAGRKPQICMHSRRHSHSSLRAKGLDHRDGYH